MTVALRRTVLGAISATLKAAKAKHQELMKTGIDRRKQTQASSRVARLREAYAVMETAQMEERPAKMYLKEVVSGYFLLGPEHRSFKLAVEDARDWLRLDEEQN